MKELQIFNSDVIHVYSTFTCEKEWYSIKRVAALNGVSRKTFNWRKLKLASEQTGKGVRKIFDANYGEVNVYHMDAWEKVYPDYEL